MLDLCLALEPETVLDIGSGYGKWGFLMKLHSFKKKPYIIGVDFSLEHIRLAQKASMYDELVLADATKLPFRDRTVDIALVCEVIEHTSKKDGLNLLNEAERVTQQRVIATTPQLYESFIGSPDHITKWDIEELKALGYKVRGAGLAVFNKKRGKIASLLRHFILKPLVYVFPSISEFMVCIKDLKGDKT